MEIRRLEAAPYLRGVYEINSHPEMLTLKIFNTISAYLCSFSCQYCYHIKQKYCIFFSPKAFCDSKCWKGALNPAGGAHDAPPDALYDWEVVTSRCRRLRRFTSVKPLLNFFCICPCVEVLEKCLKVFEFHIWNTLDTMLSLLFPGSVSSICGSTPCLRKNVQYLSLV